MLVDSPKLFSEKKRLFTSVEKISWLMKCQCSNKLIRCPLYFNADTYTKTDKELDWPNFLPPRFSVAVATNATYSLFLQEIDFQTNFSVQSPMNLGPLSASTSWSTRKTQSKIWLKSKGMFRINYGTFWDVFSLRKKDGNECSCDDNVVTRQQHYFCRFLAQSFRALSVYTTTDRIFQDVAFFLLDVVPLTNPHPLTLSWLPKNAGLLLIGSFLCPKAGKTNKSRHSMLCSRNLHRCFSVCHDLKITEKQQKS